MLETQMGGTIAIIESVGANNKVVFLQTNSRVKNMIALLKFDFALYMDFLTRHFVQVHLLNKKHNSLLTPEEIMQLLINTNIESVTHSTNLMYLVM